MKTMRGFILLLTGTFLVAGCGGGGSDPAGAPDGSTPGVQQRDFVAVQDYDTLHDVIIHAVDMMNARILSDSSLSDELLSDNQFLAPVNFQYYFDSDTIQEGVSTAEIEVVTLKHYYPFDVEPSRTPYAMIYREMSNEGNVVFSLRLDALFGCSDDPSHPTARCVQYAVVGPGFSNSGSAYLVPVEQGDLIWFERKTAVVDTPPAALACSDLTAIDVSPTDRTIYLGQSKQFLVSGTLHDNSKVDAADIVTWSTSDSTLATISGQGLATSTGEGTATISAACGSLSSSTTLIINPVTLTNLVVDNGMFLDILDGQTLQLTLSGTYSDGTSADLTEAANWSVPLAVFGHNRVLVSNSLGSKGHITTIQPADPSPDYTSDIIEATIGNVRATTFISVK